MRGARFRRCRRWQSACRPCARPALHSHRRPLAAEHKGERIALLEARKHFAWYLKGVRDTKKLKARISSLTSFEELDALLAEASGLEA